MIDFMQLVKMIVIKWSETCWSFSIYIIPEKRINKRIRFQRRSTKCSFFISRRESREIAKVTVYLLLVLLKCIFCVCRFSDRFNITNFYLFNCLQNLRFIFALNHISISVQICRIFDYRYTFSSIDCDKWMEKEMTAKHNMYLSISVCVCVCVCMAKNKHVAIWQSN